ncbi:CPBP family intramembrane metalloprotease [Williamsia muralis]|uniref:CPBP family intramembrane glutamic endopeptidase n=1 Tax=Williamsia marianensis TaxID=85044 RepID=UPI00268679DD
MTTANQVPGDGQVVVRPGIQALWPTTSGARQVMIAALVAVGLAGLVMLLKVYDSVTGLSESAHHSSATDETTSESASSAIVFAMFGVFATAGLWVVRRQIYRSCCASLPPLGVKERFGRPQWQTPAVSRTVAAFAAFGVAMAVSSGVQIALYHLGWLGRSSSADETGGPGWELVAGVAAGFWEEPLFSALPVLISVIVHRSLLVPLIVLSAVLRGGLHMYQGWQWCVLAMGWGAVAVLAYAALGSLAGLIVAHALFNATVAGPWNETWTWTWTTPPVVLVVLAVGWSIRHSRTLRSDAGGNAGRRSRTMTLPMITRDPVREGADGRSEQSVQFVNGATTHVPVTGWQFPGSFVLLLEQQEPEPDSEGTALVVNRDVE